ncbi:phosphotransferase family protein [Parasphingorhabdus pacifica]
MTEDLARALGELLTRCWGQPVEVSVLDRLSGGASRETWTLVADLPSGERRRFVLRRDPPTEPRPDVLIREAAALRAAGTRGVPEPGLIAWSESPAELGAAYILMDHVPGETIPRRILREPEYAPARECFAEQCGQILAAIHAMEPAGIAADVHDDPLESLLAEYDELAEPHPAFELAFRRLTEERPPASGAPSMVHGDFRLGNLIIDPGGVRAVLDWELVHTGDPLEDLGWLCAKAWRFGGSRPVGGMGSYAELVTAYEQAGGREVAESALHWWMVFATLRWGVMCVRQAHRHLSGGQRSVELAAIGRRVCEQEYDLIRMLDPAGSGRKPAISRGN